MGTTGMSWLWWGLSVVLVLALIQREFLWNVANVALLLGSVMCAALEWAAWATVDDQAVRWRSFYKTQRVSLADVTDVGETPLPFLPGNNPVVRLTLSSGQRRRIGPTLGVGARARAEFAEAIRTRLR